MAVVTFNLTAEERDAVRGYLKLTDAQRKAELAHMKTTVAAQRQNRVINKNARSMSAFGGTITKVIGLLGGAAGLQMMISRTGQEMSEALKHTVRFEDEITGLLSLGSNLDNIKGIRKEVLSLSKTAGISSEEVADAFFNIQSGASSLPEKTQKELAKTSIQFNKVFGTALPEAVNALVKTFNIYGDTLGSVEEMSAKLAITADQGALTFGDLARLLPDVANAAKTMGVSLEELLSFLIVGTQVGGRNEKTFTGIRNVILRMNKAIEEGVITQKPFIDQLEDLEKVDPNVLKKIFGDEAISAVAGLTQNVEKIRDALDAVKGVEISLVSDKQAKRLADMSIIIAEVKKSLDEREKAIDAEVTPENVDNRIRTLMMEFRGQEAFEAAPPGFRSIASGLAKGTQVGKGLVSKMFGPTSGSVATRSAFESDEATIRRMIAEFEKTDPQKARAFEAMVTKAGYLGGLPENPVTHPPRKVGPGLVGAGLMTAASHGITAMNDPKRRQGFAQFLSDNIGANSVRFQEGSDFTENMMGDGAGTPLWKIHQDRMDFERRQGIPSSFGGNTRNARARLQNKGMIVSHANIMPGDNAKNSATDNKAQAANP